KARRDSVRLKLVGAGVAAGGGARLGTPGQRAADVAGDAIPAHEGGRRRAAHERVVVGLADVPARVVRVDAHLDLSAVAARAQRSGGGSEADLDVLVRPH